MRYWKGLCVIGIIACIVLPSLSYGQAVKFRIGCALPLTGVFGRDGNLVKDAYTFWAETINAKGGIAVKGKKYPVELLFFDDKSDKAETAKLVERLATVEKVDLILGGYGSDSVFAASAISEKYKYPMISGGASSNKLFERGFKYYFSTLGKATEEVRGCVEIARGVEAQAEDGRGHRLGHPLYLAGGRRLQGLPQEGGHRARLLRAFPALA